MTDCTPSTSPASIITVGILTGLILGAAAHSSASTNPAPSAAAASRGVVVYVQPLGNGISASDLDATVRALVAEIGAVVEVLPSRPLPRNAFYPERGRYRAEKLLDFLQPLLPSDGDRILGVTAEDISSTRGARADWGMVGLASFTRPVGVVSKFRCLRGANGPTQARERLSKIAVHEIGHTLGLEHCATTGCVMQDARGRVSICEQMDGFCTECRVQMQAEVWLLPPVPTATWRIRPAN